MANPWDILPHRAQGDDKPEALYLAIGIALSNWEACEEVRASFFGTMLNSFGPAQAAIGTIQSSAGRASMITAAAEHALRGSPLLDRLVSLMVEMEKMAGRRNDIAHGIVRERGSIDGARHKSFGFYLEAASYNTLKLRKPDAQFTKELTEATEKLEFIRFHKYAYTAEDVAFYANAFKALYEQLSGLLMDVTRHCRKPPPTLQPQPSERSDERQ